MPTILTTRTRNPTRGTEIMSALEKNDENHLTVVTLWNYRNNVGQLSKEEVLHITDCEDCLVLLGVCQSSKSLEEAKQRLRYRGR